MKIGGNHYEKISKSFNTGFNTDFSDGSADGSTGKDKDSQHNDSYAYVFT